MKNARGWRGVMYNDGLIDMRCRVCKQGMLGDPKDKRDVCDDCYQADLEAKAKAWDEVVDEYNQIGYNVNATITEHPDAEKVGESLLGKKVREMIVAFDQEPSNA